MVTSNIMKKVYTVTYTEKDGYRDVEDFTRKDRALRYAQMKVAEGSTDVFLDTFIDEDGSRDLVDYQQIT